MLIKPQPLKHEIKINPPIFFFSPVSGLFFAAFGTGLLGVFVTRRHVTLQTKRKSPKFARISRKKKWSEREKNIFDSPFAAPLRANDGVVWQRPLPVASGSAEFS